MSGYYTDKADDYIQDTRNLNRENIYSFIQPYLPERKLRILDVGFGSARDRVYFSSLGHDVEGIDSSLPFVKKAKEKGIKAYLSDRRSFTPSHKYDLILAIASLHHLKRNEIVPVISSLLSFLDEDGVLFLSRKCRDREDGYDALGRYYTYLDEEDFSSFPFKIKVRKKEASSLRKEDVFLDRILLKKEN